MPALIATMGSSSEALPNRRPRTAWKLVRAGTPKAAPISTSTQQMTHVLGEIHTRFSLPFIHHAHCFSTSTMTIDLHQGDLIRRLGHLQLEGLNAALLKACDRY